MIAFLLAMPLLGLVLLDAFAVRTTRSVPQLRYSQFRMLSLLSGLSVLLCGAVGIVMDQLLPSASGDSGTLASMVLLIVGAAFTSYMRPRWKLNIRAIALASAISLAPLQNPMLLHNWPHKLAFLCGIAAAIPLAARLLLVISQQLDLRLPAGAGWRDAKRSALLAAILWLGLFQIARTLV